MADENVQTTEQPEVAQEPVTEAPMQTEETPAAKEEAPAEQQETPAETPQEAETEKEKSIEDRLKEKYPEEDMSKEDALNALMQKYMDESEANEREVNDLLSSDAELATVITDMMVNKLPFRAALARTVDLDALKPQEGEEDYEAWKKAYDERVAANKKMVERQKEIEENEGKSFEVIDTFCKEKNYDDKTKDSIVDFINEIFDAIVMKKISPELLQKIDNARTFDSAVREAALQGEVKGRNANIEAQRVDEMEKETGDGIPAPRAAASTPLKAQEAPEKRDIMGSFMKGIGENKWMNNR